MKKLALVLALAAAGVIVSSGCGKKTPPPLRPRRRP